MSTKHFIQSSNSSTDFLLAQTRTGSESVDEALNQTDALIEDINRQIDGNSPSQETAFSGITVAAVLLGGTLLFLVKKFAEGAASRAGEDAYDRMSKRRERK